MINPASSALGAQDPRGLAVQFSTANAAGSFHAGDLLLIDGGGNDAAALVSAYLKAPTDGGAAYTALLGSLLSSAQVSAAAMTADQPGRRRRDLHERIGRPDGHADHPQALDRGLQRVAVLNMPAITRTPRFQMVLASITASAGATASAQSAALFGRLGQRLQQPTARASGPATAGSRWSTSGHARRAGRLAGHLRPEQCQHARLPGHRHRQRRPADLHLRDLHRRRAGRQPPAGVTGSDWPYFRRLRPRPTATGDGRHDPQGAGGEGLALRRLHARRQQATKSVTLTRRLTASTGGLPPPGCPGEFPDRDRFRPAALPDAQSSSGPSSCITTPFVSVLVLSACAPLLAQAEPARPAPTTLAVTEPASTSPTGTTSGPSAGAAKVENNGSGPEHRHLCATKARPEVS